MWSNKKKTHEDFLLEVKRLVGEEYSILTKYKGAQAKVTMKHNKCGYQWDIVPTSFLRGTRCPKCGIISMKLKQRKTNEKFLQEINDLVGNEYTFLEKYINNRTEIKVRHNKCSYEYYVRPNNFLQGKRCPICSQYKTAEEFKNQVAELSNGGYELVSEYLGWDKYVKIKHKKCGHIYETTPSQFIRGSRCLKCAHEYVGKCNALTTEEFNKKLKEVSNGKCIALEQYTNNYSKIRFKNLECGHEFVTRPSTVLRGHFCTVCGYERISLKQLKTHKQFLSEVEVMGEGEYELLEQYKGDKTKIKFIHKTCNRIFKMSPSNFIKGIRCPHCSESKGEHKIYKVLDKLNVKFEREYRIKECKKKRPLPFDFAIFKNNNLKALIEYDGELHYKTARWSNANERLEDTKLSDKIKNDYCNTNNIPLIRIPYWEYDNIDIIIKKELKSLSIL
jgi:Zn ribbon nucleic-acid-binding protein